MSKIDKIIQILGPNKFEMYGLSESGKVYRYCPSKRIVSEDRTEPAYWDLQIKSPAVDNSACDDERMPDQQWGAK